MQQSREQGMGMMREEDESHPETASLLTDTTVGRMAGFEMEWQARGLITVNHRQRKSRDLGDSSFKLPELYFKSNLMQPFVGDGWTVRRWKHHSGKISWVHSEATRFRVNVLLSELLHEQGALCDHFPTDIKPVPGLMTEHLLAISDFWRGHRKRPECL